MQYSTRGTGSIGRIVVAISLLLLVLALAALFLMMRPAAAAKLGVEPTRIDLGILPLGTRTSFEFRVTNTGSGVLHFNREPYIEVLEGC
jgi:hypothetical protein